MTNKTEQELVDEHKENQKKVERTVSYSRRRKCQRRNYKIRDLLVSEHGWTRKEANGLVS